MDHQNDPSDKAIDGRSMQKAAAETLGISERQVRRLIRRYRQDVETVLVLHQSGNQVINGWKKN